MYSELLVIMENFVCTPQGEGVFVFSNYMSKLNWLSLFHSEFNLSNEWKIFSEQRENGWVWFLTDIAEKFGVSQSRYGR